MKTLDPNLTITYTLPVLDLAAVGRALFLADPEFLRDKGMMRGDAERVQTTFDYVDDIMTEVLGEDWLDGLDTDGDDETGPAPSDTVVSFRPK